MKRLEDRIKDRLEGYESRLPEGDLAEFRALLDKTAVARTKRKAAYLAWLTPAAVAAGLALFFILRPAPGVETIQVIDDGTMVAQAAEPLAVDDDIDIVAAVSEPSFARMVQTHYNQAAGREEAPDNTDYASLAEESSAEAKADEANDTGGETVSGTPTNKGGTSPFIPTITSDKKKTVSMKVGPAAAGVLCGSGAIVLASLLKSMPDGKVAPGMSQSYLDILHGGTSLSYKLDAKTGNTTHHAPLRAGLSLRVPFNDRWSLTTGVDYSLYSSTIGYSASGGHKQNAHYIGIPVRADFTIARNRWFDVYVGAGASADICVAAYDAGKKIAGDGLGFSLVGAAGVQFNISDKLGLFLDPAFSWNIPSGNRVLDTWKSDHPFMFSVATGLRITMPY